MNCVNTPRDLWTVAVFVTVETWRPSPQTPPPPQHPQPWRCLGGGFVTVNPEISDPLCDPNTPSIHFRYHQWGQIKDTGGSCNVSVRYRRRQIPRGYDREIRHYLASHGHHLARNLIVAAADVSEPGSRGLSALREIWWQLCCRLILEVAARR